MSILHPVFVLTIKPRNKEKIKEMVGKFKFKSEKKKKWEFKLLIGTDKVKNESKRPKGNWEIFGHFMNGRCSSFYLIMFTRTSFHPYRN